jgi:aminoglycoside phosphotransferase family enzyme/predicted kinase
MDQQEIVDRLAAGEAFGGAKPDRIDTHISVVFLTADRAYKLKKAQKTSYLDFRTLEDRRAVCEREIELNRRTAPAIYLGTVPVTQDADGALRLGGCGEALEWLVEMVRFDPDATFDRLAAEGRLSPELFVGLADEIALMHRTAEPLDDPALAASMEGVIEENETELSARIGRPFDAAAVEALIARYREIDAGLAGLFGDRVADGMFRVCHGDLHLRNICLFDGRPTIFDALEFNDAFTRIDVLYDVAFLLMDMIHAGLDAEANAVFNRYLYRMDDVSGLRALPYYLSSRAAIRAHVTAKMAEGMTDDAKRIATCKDADAYLAQAMDSLDAPPPAMIAIGGYSGTGKSTVAYRLAPYVGGAPGAVVLGSDLLRKRRFEVEPAETLPQNAYEPEVSQDVYSEMIQDARRVAREGRSAILDATFLHPDSRTRAETAARMAGVPFFGIWLSGDPDELVRRVDARIKGASDATSAVLRRQLSDGHGETDWTEIDATAPGADPAAEIAVLLAEAGVACRTPDPA